MSAIFKMAAKTRHKKWAVKIQHCPISSKFYMWVDNDVPTLKLNNVEFLWYCGGHFENGDRKKFFDVRNQFRTLKSNNVEFVRYYGDHFENGDQ
jgi:hypothetical protein